MAGRARWAGILAATVLGCASRTLPYRYDLVPAVPTPHALRVAVAPLDDARREPDEGGEFEYQGAVFVGNRLGALPLPPGEAFAELIARHLAAARLFGAVVLVDRPSDDPGADLVLAGRLVRARGYARAEAERDADDRPRPTRRVLAEAHLELELRRAEARVLRAEVGWAIDEERPVDDPEAAAEGALGDALRVALTQLVERAAGADLSGAVRVPDAVELPPGPVGAVAPEGWTVETSTRAEAPPGWLGAPRCERTSFRERQSQRFHRALGPYVPAVHLLRCPADAHLRYDHRAAFPAVLLGRDRDGRPWFHHALGRSSWRGSADAISARLLLTPAERYELEVGRSP